jgi:hypothetical protein
MVWSCCYAAMLFLRRIEAHHLGRRIAPAFGLRVAVQPSGGQHDAAAAAHRSDGCGTRHTHLPLKSEQPFGCFLSAWHFPQPVTHSHAGMMHISSTAQICGFKTDGNDVLHGPANNIKEMSSKKMEFITHQLLRHNSFSAAARGTASIRQQRCSTAASRVYSGLRRICAIQILCRFGLDITCIRLKIRAIIGVAERSTWAKRH